MERLKVYRCKICGNLICMIEDHGPVPMCCNTQMRPVNANTEDASLEKHVPIYFREGNHVTVSVGELKHPMSADHFIKWIVLFTDRNAYAKKLFPGEDPEAGFIIGEDENIACAYAYCNLHGLWKKERK